MTYRNLLGAGAVVLGIGLFGFTLTGGSSTKAAKGTTKAVVTSTVAKPTVTAKTEETITVRTIRPNIDQVVYLQTDVNKGSVDKVINDLEKARQSGLTHVYLVIDSPGGSVFDGAKLVSYIKASSLEIDTVCETLCASMAFHIFQTGTRRLMLDKAILMAHPASGGARGTVEEMKSMIDMVKLYVDRMDADTAKRAGVPVEAFKVRVLNNMWLEARDAVSEKFADEIITLEYIKSGASGGGFFGGTKPARIIELR